ncbi:DUF2190 family protein [Methylobacterium sp. ID0610]|uniref:DUF2190 family protein n=1 Tax=Methylobacterium carpenticola TaxID=3344827 RepID=UPI00367CA862
MPAVQSTYPGNQAAGYEGQQSSMSPADIISKTIETAGGIAPGKPAYQGSVDHACATTGSVLLGIVVGDHFARPNPSGNDNIAQGDTVSIMQKGTMWVKVSGAVTAGAPVYLTSAGAFTATASGNTAIKAIFETAAADQGLSRIKLNLP